MRNVEAPQELRQVSRGKGDLRKRVDTMPVQGKCRDPLLDHLVGLSEQWRVVP
jgi:hypothetical protein